MKTLREIAMSHGKAIIDGNTWDVIHAVNPGKVFLQRRIRVAAHWSRNRYNAGGIRIIQISRPSDIVAVVA